MNKKSQVIYKDEQGSSLISTLLLLLFLTFLMTASAAVIKNQVVQYRQTGYSYEAKAMIEMTESLIAREESGTYPTRVTFDNGRTIVETVSDNRYTIQAKLNNQYTSQKTIVIPVKAEPSPEVAETDTKLDSSDVKTEKDADLEAE